ncbi:M28 family metallopeptidase [Pseudoxanthomonas daejeonensis]|uniref:M28 family metallopeptidase n=1 Tax=Pseudoxanthomonas daejeonensis TaxID=266062 RepID=UPI001F546BC4|nr:M28 family metallopeptidase [Pseudoxanthomonas daejeonensis]UNK57114.1 M28 family metallopeptidase [Pseudoxanthomonas daejeonensis]
MDLPDPSFRARRRIAAPALLLALALLTAPLSGTALAKAPPDPVADRWQAQVAQTSAGADTAARATSITDRLDALGIAWHAEAFELDGKHGRNVVADLGGPADAPLLLIGAHYDRVDVGHGATDNASGVATVLELAQALKARPLQAHRVKLAFWDLEEQGLLGSRAWVATPGQEKPALYVNFDVFGWGDTLWMMAPQSDTPLVKALEALSRQQKLGFQPGDKYPPTDHLAFLKAGWPAVSFSLVGGDEIPDILQVFAGQKPAQAPKVMKVIHSPQDGIDQLDARNVPRALRVLENGLRSLDAKPAPAPTD